VQSKKQAIIRKLIYWYTVLVVHGKRTAFIAQYYSKKSIYIIKRRLPLLKKEHLGTFPAVHFKQMDRWDFVLKFSSEIAVLSLAFLVAGLNLYHFAGNAKRDFQDKSFVAKFLNYHPELNNRLYAKNTSIITTITKDGGLIAQAQALEKSEAANDLLAEEGAQQAIAGEQVLTKPNPDSIQSLISSKIKIYETKGGDTLGAIAAENGISVRTLKENNGLYSELIKPGWYLKIPPTDGVIHEATTNDTLPDIAAKYKSDLAKIIAYNGLENAEDIDGGEILIVPGGTLPASMLPKVPAGTVGSSGSKVNPGTTITPKIVNNGTGHIFPWGYCTWYVASKVHVPWGGNAKNWLANARAYGAVITSSPSVGSIVVTTDNSYYGHVALVEKVEGDRFMVSEMNYSAFGKTNTRWINNNSKIIRGFILP